ncbi:testicular haploid expressed gene protein [Pteropus alecto]|uniref:testicular haploid expressed gene protein n=1 Tax=Pteropus alecto TaxID=9402 RepID=UPI0003F13E8B|nr:testicular haploid expressed gene protein [Pteropus alecto]
MGDPEQSLLYDQHDPEAEARLETGRDSDALGPPSAGYESLRSGASAYQDLGDGKLGFEDQEEETLPEQVAGDEFLDAGSPSPRDPCVILGLSVSITPKLPRSLVARGRKGGRRLWELAKPKTTWQVLRDRPSVYWTDRFLEDTTLTVTVPAVSRRVEELARPKRFYSEFYNHCRTNPVWPVPRSTLEHHASNRLRELATPKVRNNIWSTHMSEVSQVSKAAQMAVPSSRILQLAKPRTPATLLAEWDPVPKPKPHVSDYNRLLHLAMPKSQSEKCVPDRAPRWEVLDVTKKAVASPRIISLAKPKERRDANEGYNRRPLACRSLPSPRPSPKKYEYPGLA